MGGQFWACTGGQGAHVNMAVGLALLLLAPALPLKPPAFGFVQVASGDEFRIVTCEEESTRRTSKGWGRVRRMLIAATRAKSALASQEEWADCLQGS